LTDPAQRRREADWYESGHHQQRSAADASLGVVRYLGIEVDDAIEIAEKIDI
jgi:hypothetical protein